MEHEYEKQRFTEAFETYADALFRHCYLRINDRERAQELMQETFMKTWAYRVRGKEIENLRAFLYQTLRNLIINEYRGRKPTVSLEELQETDGFDISDDGPEHMLDALDGSRILELLARLPDEYREVFVLRFIDGLSVTEIAEILDESENVISVRIYRGKQKLQKLFEGDHA